MRKGLGYAVGWLLVCGAPAAHAAVEIGPQQVVVTDDLGGRAVIDRAPFRITFTDGVGRTVLREGSSPVAPGPGGTIDAPPGGFQIAPDVAQYAPFAFEIGGERGFQHPGGLWTGNMLTNGRAGVVHFATQVRDAQPEGDGVKLTLSTTDPTRTISARIEPDVGSALRVQAKVESAAGVVAFADSFETSPGEAFHGFGGRHNATDQAGNDFYNWIEEEAFNSGPLEPVEGAPGSGGETYLFPNGPTQAYYVQNIFVSSRPYGFLFNRTELTRWRMASDRPDAWQVAVHGGALDYTVAVGDGRRAIKTLTEINGRHRVPPDWAIGAAVKRNVHQGNDNPETQQEKITQDIADIEKHGVELEGYVYESWDTLPEDFVRETNTKLRSMGIMPIGYVRAYVNDEGNFDPPGTFQTAVDNGYCTKTPAGTTFVSVAVGPACLLDFTNPETVEWWEENKVDIQLDLGFEGFMQDFGEQVLTDMRFHNGETGATMHNRYPIVFHSTTRELLDEYEREHPGRGPIWMYTRSGFSGRPGSAAFESSNFPGDESTDWSRSNGIAFLTTDLLNRGLGGAYGYTTDIGGYFDSYSKAGELSKELFIRWTQWAALSPHFRLHNSCCNTGTRMPWSFDDEALANWKRMSALHARATPLIKRLWTRAQRTGLPVARPLWLHYPDDEKARAEDQQWLLGPNVLVAPVVEEGATSNEVYFPSGCWQHGEIGERFEGPRNADVAAPLERLPWFVRCGTEPFAVERTRTPARIRLRLRYERGRYRGRSCMRGPVVARLVGSGVRNVRRAVFFRDGKRVARDSRRPFRKKVHGQPIGPTHVHRFKVRARLVSGDRRTFRRAVRVCSMGRTRR